MRKDVEVRRRYLPICCQGTYVDKEKIPVERWDMRATSTLGTLSASAEDARKKQRVRAASCRRAMYDIARSSRNRHYANRQKGTARGDVSYICDEVT